MKYPNHVVSGSRTHSNCWITIAQLCSWAGLVMRSPQVNVPPSLAPFARRPASGGTVAEHYLLRSRRAGGKQLRRCEKRCGSEVKCFYLTWVAHPSDQVCRIKQVELSGVLSACSPRNHVAPHVAKEVVSSAASKVSNRQPQAAVTYTVDG